MGKHRNGHKKGTVMATAHHPASTGVSPHHNFDWLWISLSVVLVALVAGGVAWAIFRPAVTVPPMRAEVIGFEYGQEATTGHLPQPGVTGEYFGYSGELYPELATVSVMGITWDPTALWGAEFSDPAELYPAVGAAQIIDAGEAASLIRSVDRAIAATNVVMIDGFEYSNDATTGHFASPGVTGLYFGYSDELFPEG
jgi:hypothetical protein